MTEKEWHEMDNKRREERHKTNSPWPPTPPLKNTSPPPTIPIKYYTAKKAIDVNSN